MKNVLLKISFAFIAAFIFIGGVVFVNAQNATSAPAVDTTSTANVRDYRSDSQDWRGYGMMGNRWNLDNNNNYGYNGNMMRSLLPGFAAGFIGLGIVVTIIGVLLLAFWVWMLVHAVRHDIDYKPVWILVLWFMNIIGAIIYYFAVKRQCPCCTEWDGCCCGGEGCNCGNGEIKEEIIEEIKAE